MEKILNTLGLVAAIIGVVIIFLYGPPQPNLETGVSLGLEEATPIDQSGKTVAQHNAEVVALRKTHHRMSIIGLGLIGIGFVFQLAAVWVPRKPTEKPGESG